MNKASIKKNESGYYHWSTGTSDEISLLAELLIDGINDDIKRIKEYIKRDGGVTFNAVDIEKKGDNMKICVWGMQCCDDEDDEEESEYYSFEMPYDKFMEMLDRWKIAFADRPDEIIVMMDDECNVTFECNNKN